jgi:hypothetical protein
MNKITEMIIEDADRLQYELRHQMATLGQISLTIDDIRCNSRTLANEGDAGLLNIISDMFEVLNDEALSYENIKEDFDVDMIKFMENIKTLIDNEN